MHANLTAFKLHGISTNKFEWINSKNFYYFFVLQLKYSILHSLICQHPFVFILSIYKRILYNYFSSFRKVNKKKNKKIDTYLAKPCLAQ